MLGTGTVSTVFLIITIFSGDPKLNNFASKSTKTFVFLQFRFAICKSLCFSAISLRNLQNDFSQDVRTTATVLNQLWFHTKLAFCLV
jgi:hypothetical protein